jgi:2-oxoglutarate ferredoxin oxidoreductase subunit alpha
MANKKRHLMLGNMACVHGAIYAGMKFYAGYPITPSTEVAEGCARELPKIGGKFIQMEDEIGSIAAIIGASVTGLKSMTATSGPGYSLMTENIGYAYMTETPVVIINVQRGGPSTGMPTKGSQADTMQARWGTHGDYTAIAVAPSTVQECLTETVRAFNLAERFRTPVTILLDEVIGHSREMVTIPEKDELDIYNRVKPTVNPEDYVPFEMTPNGVSPMAGFGEGYRFNVTGLTHDTMGFTTNRPDEVSPKLDKLANKILNYRDETVKMRTEMMEDAEIAFVSYGSVSRAALQVGTVQLYTIWPFPEKQLREICARCKKVIVGELNMGQLIYEVDRVLPDSIQIHKIQRYDGEFLTPMQLLEKLDEVI